MGFKQQQIYAQAIGMSADELGNMLQTQEKNNELVGKFGNRCKSFNMLPQGHDSLGQSLLKRC